VQLTGLHCGRFEPSCLGVNQDRLDGLLEASHRLPLWLKEPALANVRDAKELDKLDEAEGKFFKDFWQKVERTNADAQRRFVDTRLRTRLTSTDKNQVHSIEMTVGKTYVIDAEAPRVTVLLSLEDADGKRLAQSELFDDDTHAARIVFSPNVDGTYRLIVNSHWVTTSNAYMLRVREIERKPGAP
jgi:hypothetical protein